MKILEQFYSFVMDEGTGMIRQDDINAFIESRVNTPDIDLTNILHLDKSGMSLLISDKLEQLDEGWIDEEALFAYAKKLEAFSELLVNATKDKVDPTKFPLEYVKHGVKLSAGMVGVRIDYTVCNYDPYNTAASNLSKSKADLKHAEEFLKSLTKPLTLVDEDTGETTTINPTVKTGKLAPIATVL